MPAQGRAFSFPQFRGERGGQVKRRGMYDCQFLLLSAESGTVSVIIIGDSTI